MREITALQRQKKNRDRVSIFLDGDYAFSVSFATAHSLHKGQLLNDDDIERLIADGEENRAYHQALHFLGYRPRSQTEVQRRLQQKKHDAQIVESVLNRLVHEGYVDDVEFTRFWIDNRTRFRPRSARALRYELRQKGVSADVIDDALTDLDEESAASTALAKRTWQWRELEEDSFLRKSIEYLARRGFSYNIARMAAALAWSELADDDDD